MPNSPNSQGVWIANIWSGSKLCSWPYLCSGQAKPSGFVATWHILWSKDAVSDYLLLCHLQLTVLFISPPLCFLPCSGIPSLPSWSVSDSDWKYSKLGAHFKSVVSNSGKNYRILWKIIKESMGSEHEVCTFRARLTKGTGLLYRWKRGRQEIHSINVPSSTQRTFWCFKRHSRAGEQPVPVEHKPEPPAIPGLKHQTL